VPLGVSDGVGLDPIVAGDDATDDVEAWGLAELRVRNAAATPPTTSTTLALPTRARTNPVRRTGAAGTGDTGAQGSLGCCGPEDHGADGEAYDVGVASGTAT
jgi:hypothetical protein